MAIDPTAFMDTMVRRVQLTDADKAALTEAASWGKDIAPAMAEIFYDYLGRDEEMNAILNATEGRVHRLRQTFVDWFAEMFTGMDGWGKSYAERRWKIGLIHVKVGIGPQHVVPAMAVVVNAVRQRLRQDNKPETLGDALGKICMIDLAFIEQAYFEVSSQAVLQETGWTQALFQRLIATGAASMQS
ncbi:protoglobin domain-containing protein [uncultured Thermosynechococcus sp.]|uniref:protoglobin domain-containing protein n=2 Tax=uncultured Thermosynechococcus sp. TaxID=436945 RepID=UPI002629ABFE|nr:protoglobin domain-containing protein [uncultured Thermosynechococcus sp.]